MASRKCTASARPPSRPCARRSGMRSAAPSVITFSICRLPRKKSCARWKNKGANKDIKSTATNTTCRGTACCALAKSGEGPPTQMANIKLLQPNSLDEALSLLGVQGDETKIISGGTALVIMLKNRLIAPAALLSLGRLSELRNIRHEPGVGLRIGALVTI